MQRASQYALCVLLFQISPNRSDNVLHAEAVIRPGKLPQEGFNLARLKLPYESLPAIKAEE
jgi:hypothetical protein